MNVMKLIEALRFCGTERLCEGCPAFEECHGTEFNLCCAAADALEDLTKEDESC